MSVIKGVKRNPVELVTRASRLGRAGVIRCGQFAGMLAVCVFASALVSGEEAALFRGKSVTMIIGYAAGGGTDAFGRLTANFLARYLPGSL